MKEALDYVALGEALVDAAVAHKISNIIIS